MLVVNEFGLKDYQIIVPETGDYSGPGNRGSPKVLSRYLPWTKGVAKRYLATKVVRTETAFVTKHTRPV
jgi:hypothetical protein